MWLACILVVVGGASACKKYKDPAKPDIDDGLNGRRYCNNPLAVNFNWGFPGIPDSTTCIFPVDKFKGTWLFHDSVYTTDEVLQEVITRTLVFAATEDTLLTHLAVAGWCGGTERMQVTANKYGLAQVDTLLEYRPGQLICSASDTVTGYFQQYTAAEDTMKVDMVFNTAAGIRFHRGTAVKQ